MRSEHTDMPLGSERSSGSRVRLPVRTTRLMFVAATEWLLSQTSLDSRTPSLDRGSDPLATVPQVAAKSSRSRDEVWLGLFRLAHGGGRCGRGAHLGRRGRAGAELDDPEAQDAVRDLQRVVELLEQVVATVELEQVVVRVGHHDWGVRPTTSPDFSIADWTLSR